MIFIYAMPQGAYKIPFREWDFHFTTSDHTKRTARGCIVKMETRVTDPLNVNKGWDIARVFGKSYVLEPILEASYLDPPINQPGFILKNLKYGEQYVVVREATDDENVLGGDEIKISVSPLSDGEFTQVNFRKVNIGGKVGFEKVAGTSPPTFNVNFYVFRVYSSFTITQNYVLTFIRGSSQPFISTPNPIFLDGDIVKYVSREKFDKYRIKLTHGYKDSNEIYRCYPNEEGYAVIEFSKSQVDFKRWPMLITYERKYDSIEEYHYKNFLQYNPVAAVIMNDEVGWKTKHDPTLLSEDIVKTFRTTVTERDQTTTETRYRLRDGSQMDRYAKYGNILNEKKPRNQL